jgi:hypothetical protein
MCSRHPARDFLTVGRRERVPDREVELKFSHHGPSIAWLRSPRLLHPTIYHPFQTRPSSLARPSGLTGTWPVRLVHGSPLAPSSRPAARLRNGSSAGLRT